MNNPRVIKRLQQYKNLSFYFNDTKTKIEAYNANIDKHLDFDILLVVSDDMEPVEQQYDLVIAKAMNDNFPDFDGVLNFHDGHIGAECNTYPIIGKKFYERFNYIYNPEYKSLFCDEELTLVSKMLHREASFNTVLIRHNHPVWNSNVQWDELYRLNEALHTYDRPIFQARRNRNFDLGESYGNDSVKIWSILICTLEERKNSFNRLYDKLKKQINELGLNDQIEILYFLDNREHTIGNKRNVLLKRSCGKYTCFADDDDDVSDNYIKTIYERLIKNPDCVSLTGIITVNSLNPKLFIHSIKYDSWFEKDNVYYRPPNHLNPIKRSIAVQFLFPEINNGEDADWSMRLARSELLKNEEVIETPYYFYLSR
jgi:hypothetical protein